MEIVQHVNDQSAVHFQGFHFCFYSNILLLFFIVEKLFSLTFHNLCINVFLSTGVGKKTGNAKKMLN